MKALITAADIKKASETPEKILTISEADLITPAARDAAKELGVQITAHPVSLPPTVAPPAAAPPSTISPSPAFSPASPLDPALVSRIIEEVMVCLNRSGSPAQPQKEADPGGLRIVKGNSLILEDFATGNPRDQIKIKELFNKKECPLYSAGIMALDKTSYSLTPARDELNYIIEGTLECCIDNRCYTAQAGDTLYIPAQAKIILTAADKVKLFYVC